MQGIYQKGMTLIELTVVLLILVALAGLAIPYVGGTNRMALCQATDASMHAIKTAIMGGGSNSGFYMDLLGKYPKATKGDTADFNLQFLFTPMTDSSWGNQNDYNPKTAVGWRGPYLMSGVTNDFSVDNDNDTNKTDELHSSFGSATYVNQAITAGDQVALDAWGRPIVIQIPTACPAPYSATPEKCARLVSAGPMPGRDIQSFGLTATLANGASTDRKTNRVLYLKIPDPYSEGNKRCNE